MLGQQQNGELYTSTWFHENFEKPIGIESRLSVSHILGDTLYSN